METESHRKNWESREDTGTQMPASAFKIKEEEEEEDNTVFCLHNIKKISNRVRTK